MKRYAPIVAAFVLAVFAAQCLAAPPLFKKKKYFGPIPNNAFSVSVGFLDGPDAEKLMQHLDTWATLRAGFETYESWENSPFFRLGYERRVSPNHVIRMSGTFSYLGLDSYGEYLNQVTQADTSAVIPLEVDRTLKAYLFSIEIGFLYYFMEPQVRTFSPYAGGGFAGVIPIVKLDTESTSDGRPYENDAENIEKTSFQAGLHGEFGMVYYMSNKWSASLEGRYQMAQSRISHHVGLGGGNFDLDYAGFSLGLTANYHF
ncbi:MAG: outer membrane beta-barrel protein [Candidatus Krumholzibacteriota bacterium]|nr:outer membrane beta-barrel protein [Candidatus Krumholzibacteriota bacterium]